MDRRTLLKLTGATTLAAAIPTIVAAQSVVHNGRWYPVSAAWHADQVQPFPALAVMERDALDKRRLGLLSLSNDRLLTVAEQEHLESVTHHYNVRNAIRFLGGRSHTDFGFEGVDQVHGNLARHGCGCELHVVFDHHKRHLPDDLTLHPHTSRFVCDRHSHLARNLVALHDRVRLDHLTKV